MKSSINPTLANLTNMAVLLLIVFYVFYIGASIIIPFLVSVLLTLAIISLYNFFLKRFNFHKAIAIILSILTYTLVFWLILVLIQSNINQIISLTPTYQERFSELLVKLALPETLNLSRFIENLDLQTIFTSIISSVTSVIGNIGLIVLYVAFLLFEYRFFREKIHLIISQTTREKSILNTFDKIKIEVKSYFLIKFWISLVSAFISYLIMLAFGLDFAAFWAVLLFILNFIPNIGSIIAIAFPSILSFVQPGFPMYNAIIMIVLLIALDQFMGNIVEPKYTGNKLNLSPVVVILALVFWGIIWGPVGMFLSAPIMVIINIILAKFPSTRWIAILLSEKGEIEE